MVTVLPMDYPLPFIQSMSFLFFVLLTRNVSIGAICTVHAVAYMSNLRKHENPLKYNALITSFQ